MAVSTLPESLLAEYDAARTAAVVIDRSDRGLLRVWGRDPVRMVHGLVSNDIEGLGPFATAYATMLTPKGRMLADVRVIRRSDDVLIEADTAALENVRAHLKRSVPPLFARAEDVSDSLRVLGVYGPRARDLLGGVLEGGRGESVADAAATVADDVMAPDLDLSSIDIDASAPASFRGEAAIVMRTDYAGVDGWDIVVASGAFEELRARLLETGASTAGLEVLEVLRIEAGRPRWGAELGEGVIPLEAGLGERAISTTKGCYTGQEVIIRILHRGHVNRHLRGLLFGERPAPEPGSELFRADSAKPVATVTSACVSPRLGQAIALGYVRREVEPGAVLRVAQVGPEVRVVELPFSIPSTGPAG